MKKYLNFLPFLIFVIGLFLIAMMAHGAYITIIDQPTGGTTYVFTTTGRPSLCQEFSTTTAFKLSKARLEFKWLDAPISYAIRANLTDGCSGSVIATSTNDLDTSTLTNSFTAQDFYFQGTDIASSTTYGLFLYSPDGYPTTWGSRIQAHGIENYVSDTYPEGDLTQCDPFAPTNCSTMSNPPTFWNDLKFTISAGNLNNIEFEIPENSTTTIDFDYWQFHYFFADGIPIGSGEPDVGQIVVNYGLSTLNKSDSLNVFAWAEANAIIAKSNALTPGLWTATANLFDASSTLVASSTITFTISDFESLYPIVPTSTEPTATSTCATSEGIFTKGLCYVLNFLFTPSQGSVNRFTNLTAYISNKPPIGYFTEIKNALTNISTSSASTFALADISSLSNSPVGYLKTGLIWLLWFGCGFWLFHRLKHLEL